VPQWDANFGSGALVSPSFVKALNPKQIKQGRKA
jgi:hypothetical protein